MSRVRSILGYGYEEVSKVKKTIESQLFHPHEWPFRVFP